MNIYFLVFYCSDFSRFTQTVADSIQTVRREKTRRKFRLVGRYELGVTVCAAQLLDRSVSTGSVFLVLAFHQLQHTNWRLFYLLP